MCVCGVCIGMVKSMGGGRVCVCVWCVYRYGEKYGGGRVCVCVWCVYRYGEKYGGREGVCVCV